MANFGLLDRRNTRIETRYWLFQQFIQFTTIIIMLTEAFDKLLAAVMVVLGSVLLEDIHCGQ